MNPTIYYGLYLSTLPLIVGAVGLIEKGSNKRAFQYDKCINVKTILPDLFTKVDSLRQDIFIYLDKINRKEQGECLTNHFDRLPSIIIGEDFATRMHPQALGFIYKHEIGHLYFNHPFKTYLTKFLTSIITSWIAYRALFYFPEPQRVFIAIFGSVITTVATFAMELLIRNVSERSADKFAISYSSDKELIGGMLFFREPQQVYDAMDQIATKTYQNRLKKIVKNNFTHKIRYLIIKLHRSIEGWTNPHPLKKKE